ncbi:MAG: ABC transporter substrate-binding protein [Acidimicrobiales bacterium]
MKRAIIVAVVTVLVAVACGDETGDPPADETTGADRPERIVSISPTGTEMLFGIGAGDQVVAVDSFSYYPPEAPVTDLSAFEPNVEAIADLEPDLVVLDFDPGDVVSGLEALGIDTFQLSAAATFDDIYSQLEQLGAATGHSGDAGELVARMRTDIDAAVESFDSDDVLTYYHEIDTTLYSATSSTFVGQVYGLFGLHNVADAADSDGSAFGYPQLSAEYLVDADPDLIFLADVNFEQQSLDTVAARPGWEDMTAVRAGRVFQLDDDVVSRWGPRVVDFVETVAAALRSVVPA